MFVVLVKSHAATSRANEWREAQGYTRRWTLAVDCLFLTRDAAEVWLAENRDWFKNNGGREEFEIKELT